MAQQVINLGATGSGAGGDSARTAFEKSIANFAELYIAALPGTAAKKQAARDMFGLGPAAVAAILGTVSQSGGVPTGAIIERGSNANGEYVRFADGTQICWLVVEETLAVTDAYGASKYGSRGWVFPAGFSAQPAIAASARTTANLLTATPLDLPGSWSNTSCNWAFVDVAGTSYTGTARMTFSANGRWY